MSTLGRAEVVERLRTVMDPCSLSMGAPVDIWEMGLVDDVTIAGSAVCVRIVLTDVACVYFRGIRQHVVDVVRDLPGVESVEVELDASVLWTPDRMRVPPS
ncbi:MAG: metal-sulfur cluster assembly factor [Acidimicrobiia bacterium]